MDTKETYYCNDPNTTKIISSNNYFEKCRNVTTLHSLNNNNETISCSINGIIDDIAVFMGYDVFSKNAQINGIINFTFVNLDGIDYAVTTHFSSSSNVTIYDTVSNIKIPTVKMFSNKLFELKAFSIDKSFKVAKTYTKAGIVKNAFNELHTKTINKKLCILDDVNNCEYELNKQSFKTSFDKNKHPIVPDKILYYAEFDLPNCADVENNLYCGMPIVIKNGEKSKLLGIIEKLHYFEELGKIAIFITPAFVIEYFLKNVQNNDIHLITSNNVIDAISSIKKCNSNKFCNVENNNVYDDNFEIPIPLKTYLLYSQYLNKKSLTQPYNKSFLINKNIDEPYDSFSSGINNCLLFPYDFNSEKCVLYDVENNIKSVMITFEFIDFCMKKGKIIANELINAFFHAKKFKKETRERYRMYVCNIGNKDSIILDGINTLIGDTMIDIFENDDITIFKIIIFDMVQKKII